MITHDIANCSVHRLITLSLIIRNHNILCSSRFKHILVESRISFHIGSMDRIILVKRSTIIYDAPFSRQDWNKEKGGPSLL